MNKIFTFGLEWNTLSIQKAICDHLQDHDWDIKTSLAFADSGQSALIITARKEKNVILVYLENEQKQIMIKAGKDGKYLEKGKQIAKYNQTFSHLALSQATKFFEKILEDLK